MTSGMPDPPAAGSPLTTTTAEAQASAMEVSTVTSHMVPKRPARSRWAACSNLDSVIVSMRILSVEPRRPTKKPMSAIMIQ
jgi:hypothetical protein